MNWPEISNLDSVASPGLLVDENRVTHNIQAMVQMVGGPSQVSRLRPHAKTHKMPEVVRRQLDAGIGKFKAATIAEAEMVASAGGRDVLLAYQVVGPNVGRLADLIDRHPGTSFAAITDDISVVEMLAERLGSPDRPLRLFIDVDCGMHRTGIELGNDLDRLRQRIESSPATEYAGLHVYDGHLHSPSLDQRSTATGEIIAQLRQYENANRSPAVVAGGSPTFALWAKQTEWECSAGTPVFWDAGYGSSFPDLGFSPAIALLTRVISKPGGRRICLDLGYKSVASEMPLEKRVVIPSLGDATLVSQSEEHLVVETGDAANIPLGQTFLAIPRHICPTVALHAFATVVRDRRATGETWRVTARDR